MSILINSVMLLVVVLALYYSVKEVSRTTKRIKK